MATPRKANDPDADRRRALRHAGVATRRAEKMLEARDVAVRLCAELGASLRDIAEATGLSHMTVKRIIDRSA